MSTIVSVGTPTFGESVAEDRLLVVALGLNTTNYFMYSAIALVLFFVILDAPLLIARIKTRHELTKGWFLTEDPGVSKVGRSVHITSPLKDGVPMGEKTRILSDDSRSRNGSECTAVGESPVEIKSTTWDVISLDEKVVEKRQRDQSLQPSAGETIMVESDASRSEREAEEEAWEALMDGDTFATRFPSIPDTHAHAHAHAHMGQHLQHQHPRRKSSFALDPSLHELPAPRKYSGQRIGELADADELDHQRSGSQETNARKVSAPVPALGISPFRSRLEELQKEREVRRKESWGSLASTLSAESEGTVSPAGRALHAKLEKLRKDSNASAASSISSANSDAGDEEDQEARDELRDEVREFPRIIVPLAKRISEREVERKTSWASLAGSPAGSAAGSEADEDEKEERAIAAAEAPYTPYTPPEILLKRKQGPTHAVNLTSFLPFANRILLSTPFPRLPNTTVSHFVILAMYTILVATCTFWNSNLSFDTSKNPAGPDYYRSADVAMAQIPVVMLLGPRNTIIKWMFANGRDVILVKVHKLSGRLMFIGTLVHTSLYFRHWVIAGTFAQNSATPNIIAAYVATFGILVIVLTSIPFFRGAFHRLFKFCHWLGMGLFLGGLLYHVDSTRFPYIFTGVAILAFDNIVKVMKMKMTTAEMKVIPEAGTTIITFPDIKGGFRAGQYVIVRIPAVCRTGGLQGFEGHAFSVASAPGRDGGLTLMVKKAGDWTDALYNVTNKNQKLNPELGTSLYSTRVLVEGPYGGQGNENLASFSSVILVAGGSGITAPLSLCQDLLDKAERGVSVRARIIDFIFIVRTQEIARPFMPTLLALVEKAKTVEGAGFNAVRVHIYVTRCPASSPIDLLPLHALEDSDHNSTSKFSGIKIKSQRPDMRAVLNDAVDAVVRAKWKIQAETGKPAITHGCGIVVCGPGPVVTMCRDAVRDVNETKRTQIGGIDLMEEGFAL